MPTTTEEYVELANILKQDRYNTKNGSPNKLALMMGMMGMLGTKTEILIPSENKNRSIFSHEKYKFMLEAPFRISHQCCNVMKKKPIHQFEKESGKVSIIGTLAEESFLRKQKWMQNGCNSFDGKYKKSQPLSFWTEQDILNYIKNNNLKLCSVYGDIVSYYPDSDFEGQIGFDDLGVTDRTPLLKTTGCNRTGCMFCGFGCHLNNDMRFVRMKQTHPKQYEWIMKPKSEGGLGYKEVIDWINEHGNFNIKY